MNIGIVIYSQTGNTLSVAERLRDRLTEEGHSSAIERVTVEGEVKPGTPVQLTACPDPAGYDAVVFASPVQGFSLALAMKAYLEQVGGLSGKPVALYITQHLKPFFGGNKAIRQMSAVCTAKGARVCGTATVSWKAVDREDRIRSLLDTLAGSLAKA